LSNYFDLLLYAVCVIATSNTSVFHIVIRCMPQNVDSVYVIIITITGRFAHWAVGTVLVFFTQRSKMFFLLHRDDMLHR